MKLKRMMMTAAMIAGVAMFVPIGAWADAWTDENGSAWTYTMTNDCAMIVSVATEAGNISVPASLGGKPATFVGTGAFADCVAITNVVFPNREGEIGFWQGAFRPGISVTMEAEEGYVFSRWIDAEGNGVNPVSFTNDFVSVRAEFAPVVIVTNVSFRQRYPWNGLVDIDCSVECVDPTTNITLSVSARDEATGKSLAVRSVWLESDETHTNALSVTAGTYRLVWDAGRDNPGFVGENVVVAVQGGLVGAGGLYMVIDLSGGPDATSYPISFLEAEPQGGWSDEYKTTKLVMRRIPAGTFMMGSPSNEAQYDGRPATPAHEVTISEPFYIGVFQVTQKQYELVMNDTPSYYKGNMRPVEGVSWNAIRGDNNWPTSEEVTPSTFMGKLREKTIIKTFDLPTEAVWEYACRAGTTTALNSGKDLTSAEQCDNMAEVGRYMYNNSDGEGGYFSGTTTVGSYMPNLWGLYDMHGNVWEWCLDWLENYSSTPVVDPKGPTSSSSSERILRGGTCGYGAHACRSATRGAWSAYDNGISHGGGHWAFGIRLCCFTGSGRDDGTVGVVTMGRGASEANSLDLNTGVRIVTEGLPEQIAYSPRWGGSETCVVDLDGISSITNIEEGVAEWIPEGTGRHTLTHTAGDTIYTAQFTVLGEDVETHAGTLTSNEVWSADKVHLVTATVTVPNGVSLIIESGAIVKFMPGTSLVVESDASCTAQGVTFTHVNDDTVGGDTLMDGEETSAIMSEYTITGFIVDDDNTEYRYLPPQELTSYIGYDTRLRGYRTYIVSNSVTVASGATLTIQPGAVIKFNTGCSLVVNGTLDAQGTRAAPIVFTSLKDDEHGGDTNGDGDMTYAQAGDWYQISVPGTAKFNYCHVLYNSSIENTGAIDARGGTVTFDNSEIAHTMYECVNAHNSGYFTAHNSVFRDSSLGFGYYGSGRVKAYNCVFADIGSAAAIRQSGKLLVNCIFYKCFTSFTDQGGDGSTFKNCVFYNPPGYGPQSYSKVGSDGNVWGDPLFVDPDNGDFRIAADSPCVDAGDGKQSPEFDLYGQPRMDAKSVADTGTPNNDGVCPDIGIYEFPGVPAVPLPDLAVLDVAIDVFGDNVKPGDAITVTYVVTNRGKAEATGTLRDLFRFKGVDAALGGQTVDAAEIGQAYSVPTGACVTMTARLAVPMLKSGSWKVELVVNAERDVYEAVVANNASETEEAVLVSLDSFASDGTMTIEVAPSGVAGATVTGLPVSGGVVVATLPKGVAFYASVGYVPDKVRHDVAGTALADGRTALFIPAHGADEAIYVTLMNDSGVTQTVTLAALMSSDGLEIAKPADVAVTANGPKVTAKLVLPESVRDGRIYVAWVEYSNSGDQDAELPIFTVSRTGGGATFSATAKGDYSANPLPLIGLAPSAPRGKLKPGEAGRVAFYILSSGTLSVKLGMVTEKSTSTLNGFSHVADYCAGMSAAATRLCARGGADPDFTAVLAQALNEKRGAGGAAVYGTLKHAVTHLPFAGVEMHLVATNDDSVVSAALTDVNGHFVLTAEDAGDYAVAVRGVSSYMPRIVALAPGNDIEVALAAKPLSSLSGYVARPDALGVAAGAKVVLDDLSTSSFEDGVVTADESGLFAFTGLPDGEYRICLYPFEGYAIVESEVFSISNGVAMTVNMAYAARGRRVYGTVRDVETEEALTNAVVVLSRGDDRLGVSTDADGRFLFDGIAAGEWGVELRSQTHQADGVETLVVADGDGEQVADIPARAKCPFAVLRPVGMVPHCAAFSVVLDEASNLAWDFDGDGVSDSSSRTPEWTYATAGNHTVSLSYTDAEGVSRRSVWTDAVKVLEAFENVLNANGYIVEEGGDVTVESVTATELVLSGAGVPSAWRVAGAVLGAETSSKGGFIRRVLSSEDIGSNRWRLTVEEAGFADLFERCFVSGDISVTSSGLRGLAAKKGAVNGVSDSSGWDDGVYWGSKVVTPSRDPDDTFHFPTLTFTPPPESLLGPKSPWSFSFSGSFSSWVGDVVKGSFGAVVQDGKTWSWYSAADTYEVSVSSSASYSSDWTEGLTGKKTFHKTWTQNWRDFPLAWGFTASLQTDEDVEVGVEGSGTFTMEQKAKVRRVQVMYFKDGKPNTSKTTDFGVTFSTKRSLTGSISPYVDVSLTLGLSGSFAKFIGRVGGGPKVGAKLALTQSLGISSEVSGHIGTDGIGLGAKSEMDSKLELSFTPYVGVNLSFKCLNVADSEKKLFDWLPGLDALTEKHDWDPFKMEWPNTASAGKMGIDASGDDLTVTFNAQKPKIEATGYIFKDLLHLDGIEIPTHKYLWGLGDGSILQEGESVTHTYAEPGKYKVRLFGESLIPATLITYTGSPFIRTSVKWIEVFDDKPPEPQETVDTGDKKEKHSWDPNEMEGPEGVGEKRLVKPGDWMTYTVYFENKADADVPAQEVRVTNPLSVWLDWSTFEMREISFCNQVEIGLAGKQNGTITVDQNDTAYRVQATVALDQANGSVEWYLRSMDPARAEYNYWPPDGEGLLPPNDDTHRGEGYITYRIKVRDDAPANMVITNSATIIFDTNDPIETDPAWWNTVAEVAGVKINGEVEGDVLDLDLIVGMPYGELPTPKARAGYTFGGWYTGPDGTGRRVTAQSLVEAGDSGLYAHWLANAYTVRFNANGGGGVMSDQAFEFDKPGTLDANAFMFVGHSFAGWATNDTGEAVFADCAVVTNLTDVVDGLVNLYATWTVNSYTVTFDANDGTGGWSRDMEYGTAIVAPTVTREGYTFAGWQPALPATVPANDVTYTAQWEINQYTVTLDLGGGTGETDVTLSYGMHVGDIALPSKVGYAFDGWWTAADGGERIPGDAIITGDMSLHARWIANAYTVVFHSGYDGDGFVMNQAFEVGEAKSLTSNEFTRVGHSFDGWATNAMGEAVYADCAVVSNLTTESGATVNLYATWTVNSYTVTFDANGGMGGWSREMEYGAAVVAPTVARDGYTFAGWQPTLLATVPASNVVYTAQWEIIIPEPKPEPEPEPGVTPEPEPEPQPVAEEKPCLWSAAPDGAVPSVAAIYEGYLYDANGNVKGTIQVKVGKPNKKTWLAAVKATVIGTDGKKNTLKAAEKGKAPIISDGPTTVSLVGGETCEVTLGAKGMSGTYGTYKIDGSLNVFTSKDASDKAAASAALGKWQGAVNVAWCSDATGRLAEDGSPYQTLSVTIAAKGKAKVAGTLVDGTKVNTKGQLVVGENWCCVPVVYTKKGVNLCFAVWLPLDATGRVPPVVVGLADAIVGKPGSLKDGAVFRIDGAAFGSVLGKAVLPYLLDGVPVTGGAKWTLPKAGKVVYAKGTTTVDEAKLGENPSALKLTYKAKDGTFKGSFKAYADVGGKPKATTVKVTGVLVGGVGYGAATVKGSGGVAVMVE